MTSPVGLRNGEVHFVECLDEHLKSISELHKEKKYFVECAVRLAVCLNSKKKIMICGNGGSASDAQHFAAELTGRFLKERKPLAAIALTTDTSALTAIANDYGYDKVFARQVDAIGKMGDCLIGISTSGNSQNIVNAMSLAKARGITTIGLIGKNIDCAMVEHCNFYLKTYSDQTPRIQENHIFLLHMLVDLMERFYLE
jgi:D-sedoheptulose 7-phosphate isomerase